MPFLVRKSLYSYMYMYMYIYVYIYIYLYLFKFTCIYIVKEIKIDIDVERYRKMELLWAARLPKPPASLGAQFCFWYISHIIQFTRQELIFLCSCVYLYT